MYLLCNHICSKKMFGWEYSQFTCSAMVATGLPNFSLRSNIVPWWLNFILRKRFLFKLLTRIPTFSTKCQRPLAPLSSNFGKQTLAQCLCQCFSTIALRTTKVPCALIKSGKSYTGEGSPSFELSRGEICVENFIPPANVSYLSI